MGNISINFAKTRSYENELRQASQKVKNLKYQVNLIQLSLRFDDELSKCAPALKHIVNNLNSDITHLQSTANAFGEIVSIYDRVEKSILAIKFFKASDDTICGKYLDNNSLIDKIKKWLGIDEPFTEDEIDSIVYDDDGSYGGDQGSPKSEWGFWSEKKDLYNIVREYYPNMTDKEIKDYLKKLNSEGCGYVAMVNTIFAEYEGREEDFERDFGFPMYHKGDLNYDKLLVDIYASTDNHRIDTNGNDYISTIEDESATEGIGVNRNSFEYRLQKYLDDNNASITSEQTIYGQNEITTDNFMEYAEDKHVVIYYYHGNLQNEDGSTAQYINGGHAMVVTGVTSDGRFIVSSWGEKYYIDPNDLINKNGNSTRFEFNVIDYDRRSN